VTQLLTWLDEEHRKDKALLIELQGQVDAQKVQLAEQARQMREIQAALTRIEVQLPKLAQLEDSLQGLHTEFAILLEKRATETEVLEDHRARGDATASETTARIVRQLQQRIDAMGSLDDTTKSLRNEDSRLQSELNKVLDQLSEISKRVDAENERLNLLAQETSAFRAELATVKLADEDLATKSMTLKAALESLEPRLDTKIEHLRSSFDEMSKTNQAGLEAFQLRLQEQDQLAEELGDRVKTFQTSVTRWTAQMGEFATQFENNRRTLYELKELERQMRQQGSELTDLQRLAAERQRTELREWQDAQIRVDEEQMARLDQLEAWQPRAAETMEGLKERLEFNRREIEAHIEQLWDMWSDYVQKQTDFSERIVKRRGTS
jgi:chromosome segregation ATPase